MVLPEDMGKKRRTINTIKREMKKNKQLKVTIPEIVNEDLINSISETK